MSIAFFNGEFIDPNKAVIPIDERGHQFGDGVYEVVKVYDSVPFLIDEHLKRLENSAEAIRLKLPYTLEEIRNIIVEGIERSGLKDAEVYFQVTRGIAPRLHLFPNVPASFSMTVKASRVVSKQSYEDGVAVITAKDERWENCHIKSLNLLPNVLAKQNATDQGNFEAILVRKGYITEGTSSNVFMVKDDILYTTPLTCNILPGITREAILRIARNEKINVLEQQISPLFFKIADEAFISSTSVEILPIRTVNQQLIGDGKPGPITKKLHELFQKLTKEGVVH